MWILKGTSLGILFFLIGSVFYFLYALYRAERPITLAEIAIHNPAYWLAFALTIVASCVLMRFAPYIAPEGRIMWIAKGTLLGLWLLGFSTMAWLYFAIYRNMPRNGAVDVRSITALITQNPAWWTALVVCLVLGYAIARSWSGPPILWIALLVTGLIPAGFLALFITLVVKLKHASQGHS